MMKLNYIRKAITALKNFNQIVNIPDLESRLYALEENIYAEVGDPREKHIDIMSMEQTIEWVLAHNGSICRYGDGELAQIMGGGMGFQKHDDRMGEMLLSILYHPYDRCLICLTNIFGSLAGAPYKVQCFSRKVAARARREIFQHIDCEHYKFGCADVTRPYWPSLDCALAGRIFDLWKKVFKDRNLLIIEGNCTRCGVGNDLLANARSIKRILCPATDAFAKYDEILCFAKSVAHKDDLILLALGGTATILAYELSKCGFQALDVGHIDVQYMYMKLGVKDKVMVPGKYTNECGGYGTSLTDPRTAEELAQTIIEIMP